MIYISLSSGNGGYLQAMATADYQTLVSYPVVFTLAYEPKGEM